MFTSGRVAIARVQGAYVMLEDVAGDEGFVDARVFVRPEVLQRIFGDALMPRGFCAINHVSWMRVGRSSRGRTFARRHGGIVCDGMWERHEFGGAD